jgi:hypothetical protein
MQETHAPGFCALTTADAGDCMRDESGSWPLTSTATWAQARTSCIKLCATCQRCQFISYSRQNADCSWFAECDLARLQVAGIQKHKMDFRTEKVEPRRGARAQGGTLRPKARLTERQRASTMSWGRALAAAAARHHARPLMVQIGANDHSQDADGGDVAPQLLRAGWRGLLVEPMPQTFARLSARYAQQRASVRCLNALVATACTTEDAVDFWGLDTSNATGLWGSARSDARCVVGDRDVGWLTELSSLTRSHATGYFHYVLNRPDVCARCSARLGKPLAHDCLSQLSLAVRRVRVPCLRWDHELAGEFAVHMLLIDAERHDHEVIEQYPFERLKTWRVIFEASRINRTHYERAASRLRAAGFQRLQGAHGAMQAVFHHVDSEESVFMS